MKMKHKFPGEGRKNALKNIPWRQNQPTESLRHSNVRRIRL